MTDYPERQVSIFYKGWNIVFPSTGVSINSSLICEYLFSEFQVISTRSATLRQRDWLSMSSLKEHINPNTTHFDFGESGPWSPPFPQTPFPEEWKGVVEWKVDWVQIQPRMFPCGELHTAFLSQASGSSSVEQVRAGQWVSRHCPALWKPTSSSLVISASASSPCLRCCPEAKRLDSV